MHFKGEHMIKGVLVGTCSSDFVQRVRYSPPHFYYDYELLVTGSKSIFQLYYSKIVSMIHI